MPAKKTDEEYKSFIHDNFPTVRLIGKVPQGTDRRADFMCTIHKKPFTNYYNNFQIQWRKATKLHKKPASICPLCVYENRPDNSGTNNPAALTAEILQHRLNERFGKNQIILVGKYKGKKVLTNFKCVKCSTVSSHTPGNLLGFTYPCSCVRIKHLVPFATLTDNEKKFIAFCYGELDYSVEQISQVSGVASGTVRKVLIALGLQSSLNTTNNKRRVKESLKNNPNVDSKTYKIYANKITGYVYRAYKAILDPKGLRDITHHLDHNLSKHDGYSKFTEPVPLSILCHPANLRIIKGADNLSKNQKSHITLKQLKARIKKFEIKYGAVIFPKHLLLEFSRQQSVVLQIDKGLRVMGCDPGTANFGVFGGTLYGVKSLHRIKPAFSTMIKSTFKSFGADCMEQQATFMLEIETLMRRLKPHVVIVERFQTRGIKGATIEYVSYMCAIISAVAMKLSEELDYEIIFKPVIASQWKNAINRKVRLDDMYDLLKAKQHHRLDACLMALSAFPDKDVYSFLTKAKQKKLVHYIDSKTERN